MKPKKQILQGVVLFAVMIFMLIDVNTAKGGATEGIMLCIQSVIPSLFPFIFLSLLMTSRLYGKPITVLSPFSKAGVITRGCETVLIMAFLGGYPVGAQTVYNAWSEGSFDNQTARRLMGFCNNAGPSFIFGILSGAFARKSAVWLLWLIQIGSALMTGWFLRDKQKTAQSMKPTSPLSITTALKRAISTMAGICGWIILIRTFLPFLSKYLFKDISATINVIISGFVELTNGCLQLSSIPDDAARFVVASCLLSSGGLCVYLQTRAVTGNLGTGLYLQGKLLQTLISFVLSCVTVSVLYAAHYILPCVIGSILLAIIIIIKKVVAIC